VLGAGMPGNAMYEMLGWPIYANTPEQGKR
jgi:hypothetical protein